MNGGSQGAEKRGNGRDSASELWAITSYFNPTGYARRLANFRNFRRRLRIPLVAVELEFGHRELQESDADILVRVRGGDLMWQKERLLNIALRSLPPACTKVAWIDADVIFGAADWPEHLSRKLDRYPLVQGFSQALYLPSDWSGDMPRREDAEMRRDSIEYAIASGIPAEECLHQYRDRTIIKYAIGLGWAARRALLDRHGFYDAGIIGGGDKALVCAAHGRFEDVMGQHHMNGAQRRRYVDWAEPFHADVGGRTAVLDGDLFHLWHGTIDQRGYLVRHRDFSALGFDPNSDIALNEHACWRWNSNKPQLHQFVRDYFSSREIGA